MNIPHKKLAFYVALIFFTLTFALLILDVITMTEAQLFMVVIAGACATLGIPDQIYDFLGLMVKIGEHAAAATPSLEDDKKVAEFKQIIKEVRQRIDPENVETVG